MPEQDDLELVRACLTGDTRAFETLVERYQKPIFNAALRMVTDFDDAQDITQTVFVKAYEKLNTFKPKYKFFSWIYRMAVNESINFLNKKRRHENLDMNLSTKDRSPDQHVATAELERVIGVALMSLSVEYRAVIVLRHFENFSYRDISYILNTPEKTVKSRLYLARQQLREILLKRGIEAYG